MILYKAKEFCERVRISIKTLERLEKSGKITPIRRGPRLRYYTEEHVSHLLGIFDSEKKSKRKVIAYYRVSTNSQKREMIYQRQSIEKFCLSSGVAVDEYLSDIGSGINFKRKNFLKIIDMIERGEISKLIFTHKDRLTRFAYELIEERCSVNNVELVVINLESSSPQKELVEDLMTIIHVFSCRLHALRKYKNQIKEVISNGDDISED